MIVTRCFLPALFAWAFVACVSAAEIAVVSHVSVVSDRVADVSSLEAWKRSFITDGMTDEQKAIACFTSVVSFLHHEWYVQEHLLGTETCVHDPIKAFNVYGYGHCCCTSAYMSALARTVGLEARGWGGITGHSMVDIGYGGGWHVLDPSFIHYHPRADGSIAGMEELGKGVSEWLDLHPDLRGNQEKLVAFMLNNGWKQGPEVMSRCPFFNENGWLPENGHGWYTLMACFDSVKQAQRYEYGYALGYEVNNQLRRGERITFNWSNTGRYLNKDEGDACASITEVPGAGAMAYAPAYGDLTTGRVGNGVHEYEVPLAEIHGVDGALLAENLAGTGEDGASPAIHVRDAASPATLIVRMPSSYVYLGGSCALSAVVAVGGRIAVSGSDNNGLDWRELAVVSQTGDSTIDLRPLAYRRYDYRIKVVCSGAGTGLAKLRLTNDIQHSQRALPSLGAGTNTVSVRAGPAEGTIVIEGNTNPEAAKGTQLAYSDFHAVIDRLSDPWLTPKAGTGSVTFPVETPGDLTRLRIGSFYRARDAADGYDILVSYDAGKTFASVGKLVGPTQGMSTYLTIPAPGGMRSALVRFTGTMRNTACLFGLRISADYMEPHGGFCPLRVTYVYDEAGVEKRVVRIVRAPSESYAIECTEKPVMKSLVLELAPAEK